MDFPGVADGKESTCNAGDPGSTPRSGRSPGEWNGYPLQYSCQENSMDREVWGLQSMGPHNAGDTGLIPEWGRSPGEGNDNPLQYSYLENPMDT